MELEFSEGEIRFERIPSSLDEFVFEFTSKLDEAGMPYVIVSGYVCILFGRNRSTEDVDVLVGRFDGKKFGKLWSRLIGDYECQNTSNPQEAFNEYLMNNNALRFSRKREFIPNIEFKFTKDDLDKHSLENSVKVHVNDSLIRISPLELQIAYKLFLGSEKDIEDARFLYKLFEDQIIREELDDFIIKLDVKDKREYLNQG